MAGEGGGAGETVEQPFPALPPAARGQVFSPARAAPLPAAPAVPPDLGLAALAQGAPLAAPAVAPQPSGVVGDNVMAAFGAAPPLPLPPMPAPEPAAGGAALPTAPAAQPPAVARGKFRLKVAGAATQAGQAQQGQATPAGQPAQQQLGALLPMQEAPPALPPAAPPAAAQAAAGPPPAPQAAAPAAKPLKLKLKIKVQPPPQ